MTDVDGKVAVVTGAGSGIGRALAHELARRGARLAISDVDVVGLAATGRQVRVIGAELHETPLDVSDRAAVLRYAEDVAEHFGTVNIVINNAGIAFAGEIEDLTFDQIESVMDVNFWGVVHGTKAFLPHLLASGDGHVVNISSAFGLMSVPGQGAYNAAKFAVRGFTEALRQEMLVRRYPVQVTCVHPGGVKTAIARNAGSVANRDHAADAEYFDTKLARLSPDAAAKAILRAVTYNRPRALVGMDAKLLDVFVRLTGAGYERAVALGARRRTVPKDAPSQTVRD